MKMFLLSSAVAIVIAVASFYLLQSTGMDTASVMSGQDVRLRGEPGNNLQWSLWRVVPEHF